MNKKFKIKLYLNSVYPFIPQPRFLKRWYYRKSFDWWGHPLNHHWKYGIFMDERQKHLKPFERDLITGSYDEGINETNKRKK